MYELTWEDSTSCKRCQAEGTESIYFIVVQYQLSCRHGGNCVWSGHTEVVGELSPTVLHLKK